MKRLIYFYHDGNGSDLHWALEIMTRQVCDASPSAGPRLSDRRLANEPLVQVEAWRTASLMAPGPMMRSAPTSIPNRPARRTIVATRPGLPSQHGGYTDARALMEYTRGDLND